MVKILFKNKLLIISLLSASILLSSCTVLMDEIENAKFKNYKWETVSLNDDSGFMSTYRKDLSIKGDTVYGKVNSGTGSAARVNFSCGNLGLDYNITGIDADVWLNENIQSVGVQWFTSDTSAQFYWIYMTRWGNVGVTRKQWITEKKAYSEKGLKYYTPIDRDEARNKYHNFKIYLDDAETLHMLFDGEEFLTIPEDELLLKKGNYFVTYQEVSGQQYSSENAGEARIRIKHQQKKK